MDIEAYLKSRHCLVGRCGRCSRCGLTHTHEGEQGVRVKERYNSTSYTELRPIVLKR